MKYLITILLAALLLVPFQSALTAPASATIPTFSIVSVVTDASVTIQTANFPAGYTFTVRMGEMGTLGINGVVVGTTASGSGGSFSATYNIPASLQGDSRIAIRMDSTSGGFFAYNWFWNSTTGSTTPVPTTTPVHGGYTGIPTFSILSVVTNDTVTIRTNNFPAGKTWTARMGAIGTLGIGGTVVGTTTSASGGTFDATYDIPAALVGASRIAIRLESTTGGYFAYNWFYNSSTGTTVPTTTPGPTTTPVPGGYTGFPTFTISSVVRDSTVTILTRNMPPNTTFTARMGAYGTQAVGGTVVGTTDTGTNSSYSVSFNIPASLAGSSRIAIRLEAASGYFAYNWFYNNTYP